MAKLSQTNKAAESAPRLNRREHPEGTRLLQKPREHSTNVFESVVVEWAPTGARVKLRNQWGIESWYAMPPYLIEVLPAEPAVVES